MADKKITISGKLNIDSTKAAKALEEISKKFKSFEKSAFTKQMEDMRKLQPLVKSLDKDLGKMMQTMSKSEAKNRIKELNTVLKDQSKELKEILNTQEKLNRAIKSMPAGSARDAAIKDRNDSSHKARAVMGSMENFGQEREELKKIFTQDFIKKIAQGIQVAANVGAGMSSFMGMRELNRLSLEAQSSSTGNRIGSMAYQKNADLGSLVAFGDFGSIVKGSREGFTGQMGAKGLSAGGNILGGALNGSIGGPGGALAGAGGAAMGEIAKNIQYGDPKTRAAAFGAVRAGLENQGMDSALAKTQFPRELMNTLIDQAPMKVSAMQAMVGAGSGAYGRGLGGLFGQNYGMAVRHGVEMPEAAAMMQIQGQSGAIGAERGSIATMLQARNAGIAQPGEFGSLISGMANTSGDGSRNVSMMRKAMEEGVKTGVDRSMVKNLVRVTEEIASTNNLRIQDGSELVSIIDNLRSALGPSQDMSKIGAAQLQDAQSALATATEHTGSALGLGIDAMVMQERVDQLGGGQLSPAQMIMLGKTKVGQKIDEESDLGKSLMETFGGDAGKFKDFNSDLDDLRRVAYLRSSAGYGDTAGSLTTLDSLRDYQMNLMSDDPATRARAEKQRQDLALMEGAFKTGDVGTDVSNWVGGWGARKSGANKIEDESGQTGAGGLARYRAALESLQQAAAGQKEMIDKMKTAMDVQLAAAKDIANSPIVETMADGSVKLTISMDSLKNSVDALNQTMGGKLPDRTRAEIEQARTKAEEHAAKAREAEDKMHNAYRKGNYADAATGFTHKVVEDVQSWWNSPGSAQDAVDNVNNTLIPQIKPKVGQ